MPGPLSRGLKSQLVVEFLQRAIHDFDHAVRVLSEGLHELPVATIQDLQGQVRGRYLAVSTTLLYGSYNARPEQAPMIDCLRHCQPIDRTTTFFIFDVTTLSPDGAQRPLSASAITRHMADSSPRVGAAFGWPSSL